MHDVAVVGAGAAGLFAALAASGALREDGAYAPSAERRRVILLDGQARPGKKILISGGGRCNVTNAIVSTHDFATADPKVLRSILLEFPVAAVRAFFGARGVPLREEPVGKLFPKNGRALTVLTALRLAIDEAGVECRFGAPVASVEPIAGGWRLDDVEARRVIIATGGRSVPATGSTGFGYGVAEAAGHTLVPSVPALAALLSAEPPPLAGLTVPAILSVVDDAGRSLRRAGGSVLFTHAGVSGPAALDVSIEVERAVAEGRPFRVLADLWTLAARDGPFAGLRKPPGACLRDCPRPSEPRDFEEGVRRSGRSTMRAALADRLPRRLGAFVLGGEDVELSQLSRNRRREIAQRVVALDLGVTGSEGYKKAEVTAGGVPLRELHRRTLESRLAPGLYFCGEVCDVTGRLGGFNFQWAWSSGFIAGRAAGAAGSMDGDPGAPSGR